MGSPYNRFEGLDRLSGLDCSCRVLKWGFRLTGWKAAAAFLAWHAAMVAIGAWAF